MNNEDLEKIINIEQLKKNKKDWLKMKKVLKDTIEEIMSDKEFSKKFTELKELKQTLKSTNMRIKATNSLLKNVNHCKLCKHSKKFHHSLMAYTYCTVKECKCNKYFQ